MVFPPGSTVSNKGQEPLIANIVTTSKALVTTSVALVPNSFLLLLVRHLLLEAMHLLLLAFLFLVKECKGVQNLHLVFPSSTSHHSEALRLKKLSM